MYNPSKKIFSFVCTMNQFNRCIVATDPVQLRLRSFHKITLGGRFQCAMVALCIIAIFYYFSH